MDSSYRVFSRLGPRCDIDDRMEGSRQLGDTSDDPSRSPRKRKRTHSNSSEDETNLAGRRPNVLMENTSFTGFKKMKQETYDDFKDVEHQEIKKEINDINIRQIVKTESSKSPSSKIRQPLSDNLDNWSSSNFKLSSPKKEDKLQEGLIVLDEVVDDDLSKALQASRRIKDAAEIIKEKRRESYVRDRESGLATGFLFIDDLNHLYECGLMHRMLEKYIGKVQHHLPEGDALHAERFLQLNDKGSMDDLTLDGNSLSSYLPSGQPLLEYIKADTWPNGPGWRYPDLSVFPMKKEWGLLTNQTRKEVQSMEITIARHIPDIPDFLKFVQDNIKQSQEAFPVGIVALHYECIYVSGQEYKSNLLDQPEKLRGGEIITISLARKNIAKLPVRIVFGDGINWMATIRLPIEYENTRSRKGKQVTFKVFNADPRMVSLLDSLPTLVGRDVRSDVDMLCYIMKLYQIKTIPPPAVDIGALALVCGWDISNTDLFSLHLAVTGKVLNLEVSTGDSEWFLPLRKLNMALMTCMIGNIRSSYVIATTFLTLLVRNLFPDPDVLCFALELKQGHAFSWVAGMILNSLSGAFPAAKRDFRSRNKLAMSMETDIGDRLHDDKIRLLAKLIPTWPHVTGGGPRFLHNVRVKFVEQFKILQELKYRHPSISADIDKMDINEVWLRSITFGRDPVYLSAGHPVEKPGLLCHPDLKDSLLELHSGPEGAVSHTRLTEEYISSISQQVDISKTNLILEYCRLNPSKIDEILRQLVILPLDTREFNYFKRKYYAYERMRSMHYFLYDQPATKVEEIDLQIRKGWEDGFNMQVNPSDGQITKEHQLRAEIMLNQQWKSMQGVSHLSGKLFTTYKSVPTSSEKTLRNRKKKAKRREKVQRLIDKGVKLTDKSLKHYLLPSANLQVEDPQERLVHEVDNDKAFNDPSGVEEMTDKCLENENWEDETISDDEDELVMRDDDPTLDEEQSAQDLISDV